jgi:hypothetical protein
VSARTVAVAGLGLLLGLSGAFAVEPPHQHTDPNCWQKERFYQTGKPVENFPIAITHGTRELPKPFTRSPNQAYAFHVVETDLSIADRTVLVAVERPYLLEIRLPQVLYTIEARWINEKLLYLHVWLGRAVGADLIVDVEKEKVIHTDAMEDGEILWRQARESCKALTGTPGSPQACTETCYPLP